ncbi:MAG: histidine triad nucleotide-binding protein [Byssovorax sp.]
MCLFCKIAAKQIPSKVVFEDDEVLAFHDINPGAPTHVLVIPKRHVASIDEATAEDAALLGKLLLACQRAAREAGITQSGFRVVSNTGPNAGQSVFHLHFHVLGGRAMAWPPG